MTPTSHLKGSTKNTTPSPTPLSIPQTMPLVDNEDMSTAKYLKQVLITLPSGLEESEIVVLQETISVLRKDLSTARAEIAVLRLDLTNAKSYSNTLENHIKPSSAACKSASVSSLSSEVTDPSQSKLKQKSFKFIPLIVSCLAITPQYQTQLLMMKIPHSKAQVNGSLTVAKYARIFWLMQA
ncbi:hypothetical protein QYM36_015933 [Artemia franciscana]|uniref:Uncharacterized protein n=1 Tax=Artemia franciscana TaxID=6661 RepID=A0AA88HEX2_ARTSF|nr:hypothetical protein QYM36_015933 [Artemia franciscana]